MARARKRGFAMVDVLVALLLLAVALGGACVTLVHAMRTTHGAMLTSRAIDLAADLTEELRGASSVAQAEAKVGTWRQRVAATLPVHDMQPEEFAALVPVPAPEERTPELASGRFEIVLRWHGSPATERREIRLPLFLPALSN